MHSVSREEDSKRGSILMNWQKTLVANGVYGNSTLMIKIGWILSHNAEMGKM